MTKLSAMDNMYLTRYQKLYGKGTSQEFFDKADEADRLINNLRVSGPNYQDHFNRYFYEMSTLANYAGLLAFQEGKEVTLLISANPHPTSQATLPLHPKIVQEVKDSGIPFVSLSYENDGEYKVFVLIVRIKPDDARVQDIKAFVSRFYCSVRYASAQWFDTVK